VRVDFDELLCRQDGVVARWQVLRYLTASALRHKVRSGRWRRAHSGVYLTETGAPTPKQRGWVAVLAARVDARSVAALAGLTALGAWGLRGIDSHVIHVLVPHNARIQPPAGVAVHRTRLPLDLDRNLRPPATMPDRSLLDATQWARTDHEANLIIAATFQQRLVRLPDVRRAVEAMPNMRRRQLLLRTAEDAAGGSHSLSELDLLALCREYELPTPTRQVERTDGRGRRRYVDALFEDYKVAIEVDGAHHVDVWQMWADAEKANSLELDGFLVLRYPAFVVRTEPARVAREIAEALRRKGWGTSGTP
jgi:hypothetical protein